MESAQLLLLITAAAFVLVGAFVVVGHFMRLGKKQSKTPYTKQPEFLTPAELRLFGTLAEVCGDRYLVFPQAHLGRVLEVKPGIDWKEVSNYRSRIDRKSADFLICGRDGSALVVVELGGDKHNFGDTKARDTFLDNLAQVEGLELVYLKPGMDAGAVRTELQKVLQL